MKHYEGQSSNFLARTGFLVRCGLMARQLRGHFAQLDALTDEFLMMVSIRAAVPSRYGK